MNYMIPTPVVELLVMVLLYAWFAVFFERLFGKVVWRSE